MNRRNFVLSGGAAMAMSANAAGGKQPSILELRVYKLRNTLDMMPRRAGEFFEKSLVPAIKRAGIAPVGVFQSVIAPDSPFLMTLVSYPNMGAFEAANDKLFADAEFNKARESFNAAGLPYVRIESTLLRGFPGFPAIEVPAAPQSGSRVYEIRVYESNSMASLARKIRMFDEGETDLFRKVGMAPVFFGQTIAGRNMPNLTYMVGFDNLAAREKVWGAFGSSPEWKKMSSQPGVSDGEVVSNISNMIVRPTGYSDIR